MQEKFELWLDESGEFYKEREKRRENMLPSLIGGFLVPAKKVSSVLATASMDEDRNHAMHLSERDKREYVLPLLQKLVHEHGLSMVFFENTLYEDAPTNRQLYLQLMAEGILQLIQKLDGLYESVDLAVWIAQRRDVHNPNPEKARIDEAEYIAMLQRVMEQKRKERRILLNEDTRVHFVVRPAHKEQRLQYADFACNTRLTRFSEAFDSVRSEVEHLYDTAHLFDFHESSSENYIKICMEKGDVADAIMELFTTWEALDRTEQLEYVMDAMQNNTVEQNEVMLGQCVREIESHVYHQEDYDLGQLFLEHLAKELLPKLEEKQLPFKELKLKIGLLRLELSLKQGNTERAELLLADCKGQLQAEGIGNAQIALELRAKEALLDQALGRPALACQKMEEVLNSYRRMWECLNADPLLIQMGERLSKKDYLDALSLYIYILLDGQTENSQYDKIAAMLRKAIEIAKKDCLGKLDRLYRYFSFLEMKAGHIEEALKWLFQVDEIQQDYTFRQQASQYLKKLQLRKNRRDIQFGVMYYLAILARATKEKSILARTMFGVFREQSGLLEFLEISSRAVSLPNEVDVTRVAKEESEGKGYHPMEQIYKYYGQCLMYQEKYAEALIWYRKALGICFANPEYVTMRMEGLKIAPQVIECIGRMGNTGAVEYERQMAQKQADGLLLRKLPEQTKEYIMCLRKEI
ncbi:MAG: hypothetical protein IJY10_03870 [Lachnospiraceae bacterium]|nr:hypothetical protein [Lachnospiraceae bacterium]